MNIVIIVSLRVEYYLKTEIRIVRLIRTFTTNRNYSHEWRIVSNAWTKRLRRRIISYIRFCRVIFNTNNNIQRYLHVERVNWSDELEFGSRFFFGQCDIWHLTREFRFFHQTPSCNAHRYFPTRRVTMSRYSLEFIRTSRRIDFTYELKPNA